MHKIIIPKPLKQNDTIGLVAPAFAITNEQLEQSINNLQELGFKTKHTDIVLKKHGYFAGTDEQRANDLMQMFADKEINGIMCIRGGYGTSRICNLLDYNIIQNNPKPLIGYSDITFLQNAIFKETGLVTYHGLTGVCDFNSFSTQALTDVICNTNQNYEFKYNREPNTETLTEFDKYTITKGTAEGTLIGGNLSVLVSMIGTEFAPSYKNKIVFIEDIDERTYRIDRMLTQLVQATDLSEANGIVFGIFRACSETKQPFLTLKEAIEDIIKPLNIPSSYGLSFGHIKHKITLPIGLTAQFNADKNLLRII